MRDYFEHRQFIKSPQADDSTKVVQKIYLISNKKNNFNQRLNATKDNTLELNIHKTNNIHPNKVMNIEKIDMF